MTSTPHPMTAKDVVALLGLEPLPEEGGLFTQTYADDHSTCIYALLAPPDFSAMHRLTTPEIYHFYAGDPTRMLLLHPDGRVAEPVLGTDLAAGQRPQVVVPAGVWQGSSCLGAWSLWGTTMAPGFDWEGFELGAADELVAGWPAAAGRIRELTRS